MAVIDDEGRLFGLVNVVDAVVVALVVAAAVGGFVLVDPLSSPESATRYATVEVGEQRPFVADQVSEGDVVPVRGGAQRLTVTDVHVSPTAGENVTVAVRVRLDGRLRFDDGRGTEVFSFDGAPTRRGRTLTLDTPDYTVTGTITAVGPEGTDLPVETRRAVLQTAVPVETAGSVRAGDEFAVGDTAVATVETVRRYPTSDPGTDRLVVGVSLRVLATDGEPASFAGRPLVVGSRVPVRTASYNLSGRVVHLGNATLPGSAGQTTAVVRLANVTPELADSLSTGLTESRGSTVTATVTGVRVDPASVVLVSDGGEIFGREHPRNRDVSLTVDLRTRSTDSGLQFRGQPIRTGDRIVLDLGRVRVRGRVTELRADDR